MGLIRQTCACPARKEKDIAVLRIDPAATRLTVFQKVEGDVRVCRCSYSLTDADGVRAVPIASKLGTVFGPNPLPPPPRSHIGGRLTTRFTCKGIPGTTVLFHVEIEQTVHPPNRPSVPPRQGKIPQSGLLSFGEDHDLC